MQVLVGAAALKRNLNVLLVLSKIWGSLLEVDHGTSVHEGVRGKSLGGAELTTLIEEERTGEIVAVIDVEDTLVEADVLTNIQVFPGVGLDMTGLGDEMAFKENALGNAGVGNASLQNVDGVIL
jgi:hypothetical protein